MDKNDLIINAIGITDEFSSHADNMGPGIIRIKLVLLAVLSGRSDGLCVCGEQTERPWSASEKTPSVAISWDWGCCALKADLGNNAVQFRSSDLGNNAGSYL